MSKIVFSHASLSDLTLEKGRLFPINKSIEVNQERHLTESLNPKVIVYSGTLKLWSLEFAGLSKDNYDGTVNGLKTWFEDSNINWSENSFTVIDELGESYTMRLWQDEFNMPEDSYGNHSIELIFLEE